jgi:thiaminase (transcriptional activator TenA)
MTITTTTTESLSERLRNASEPLWAQLFKHPFVVELAAGTLPLDRFRFYLEQDRIFLFEYARALAAAAGRTSDDDELRSFATALRLTVDDELQENARLLGRVIAGGAADRGGALELGPAAQGYVSFLHEVAFRRSSLEIAAALLPCPWSYAEIGRRLGDPASDHPLYREWLENQRSDEALERSDALVRDLDTRAAAAADVDFERLATIFRLAVRYELAFWDAGYGLIQWPDRAAAHPIERNT